jgi:hypothetical protein
LCFKTKVLTVSYTHTLPTLVRMHTLVHTPAEPPPWISLVLVRAWCKGSCVAARSRLGGVPFVLCAVVVHAGVKAAWPRRRERARRQRAATAVSRAVCELGGVFVRVCGVCESSAACVGAEVPAGFPRPPRPGPCLQAPPLRVVPAARPRPTLAQGRSKCQRGVRGGHAS